MQQSPSSAQKRPAGEQAQRPSAHLSPQHCAFDVQEPPLTMQAQSKSAPAGWQIVEQQSAAVLQGNPMPPQQAQV